MSSKGKRVAIVGYGSTSMNPPFQPKKSWKEFVAEAVYEAIGSTRNIEPRQLQVGCIGYHGEGVSEFGGIGPTVSDLLAISPNPVYAVSGNCTSGAIALNMACAFIRSEQAELVFAAGYDKDSDHMNYPEVINLSTEADYDYEFGFTHADYFAMCEAYYMRKYKYGPDILARFAYDQHWYARRNPRAALYGQPMPTIEQLLRMGGGLFATRAEGCAAVILASEENAHKYTDKPIFIDGISYKCMSQYMGHHARFNELRYPGTDELDMSVTGLTIPTKDEAFKMAGITAKDINLATVYDAGATSIMQLEALGLFPYGEGGKAVLEGGISVNGRCPTNTDGGNMGRGHSSGGDGLFQVMECAIQLRGEAGERQVPKPKIAVCHDVGGIVAHCTVVVLGNQ